MPAYEYHALDASGKVSQGVLQADTPRSARASLRERGLHPLQLAAADEYGARQPGALRRGLRGAQLALLTRQLATLITAGLPIDEALQALAEGCDGRLQMQVISLRARVMEGASLAGAMAEFPETFPALFRASVAAAESAGKLDIVLQRLADYTESRDALRRRLLLSLTYPCLLTVVALGVVVGLMVWVVPQVVGVFSQNNHALPLPTLLLIAVSDVMRNHAGAIALLALSPFFIAWFALRRSSVRVRWDASMLRLPLIGRLMRAMETARFSRTLALLVGGAVPLLEALSISAQVVSNEALRQALMRVSMRVREGQSFARALADTQEFPPVTVRLIASGEKSGKLSEMLFEAAAHQERELDTALGVMMAALGPGVILIVGGMVLFIVLAILLPIFELNTLIR